MKPSALLLGLLAPLIRALGYDPSELPNSVQISIQPISSALSPISPVASIQYNPNTRLVNIEDYIHPDLSPDVKLLRVGVYDAVAKQWRSSVSTTSVENFGRGIRPTIVLSLDQDGQVLVASIKGAAVDAGQTRDFGPTAKIVTMKRGKLPELNKPIVLSKEGTLDEPEPEKTLLQRSVTSKVLPSEEEC